MNIALENAYSASSRFLNIQKLILKYSDIYIHISEHLNSDDLNIPDRSILLSLVEPGDGDDDGPASDLFNIHTQIFRYLYSNI